VLGGAGMGLSFVPVTIASLSGVERSDAGVASGLINTSRQIGGAIGLAAVSAIATASTNSYARGSSVVASTSRLALDHGFRTALDALAGLLIVGAVLAAAAVRPAPAPAAEAERVEGDMVAIEEAA